MKSLIFSFICCILLLCNYANAFCQVYKYRAIKVLSISNDKDGEYADHIGWFDCDRLVVINNEKLKIQIFSKNDQSFDILNVVDTYTEKGCEWIKFSCLDKNGTKCVIREVHYKEKKELGYERTLYVDYLNFTLAYRLKNND